MKKLLDRGAGTVEDRDEVKCMFVRILHAWAAYCRHCTLHDEMCVCALVSGVEKATY